MPDGDDEVTWNEYSNLATTEYICDGRSSPAEKGGKVIKITWHPSLYLAAALLENFQPVLWIEREDSDPQEIPFPAPQVSVYQMLWGWDDATLIVVAGDSLVRVWNLARQEVTKAGSCTSDPRIAPEKDEESRSLATFESTLVRLWSEDWELVHVVDLQSPCCAFAWRCGYYGCFAARTEDSQLHSSLVLTPHGETKVLQGALTPGWHQDRLSWDPSGQCLATSVQGVSVLVWRPDVDFVCSLDGSAEFTWLLWAADSGDEESAHVLATVQDSGEVRLWSVDWRKGNAEVKATLTGLPPDPGMATRARLTSSCSGRYLAAVGDKLSVWDTHSPRPEPLMVIDRSGCSVTAADWHPFHEVVAVGFSDGHKAMKVMPLYESSGQAPRSTKLQLNCALSDSS